MWMSRKAVWTAALLLVGATAFAKTVEVKILGIVIPSVTAAGTADTGTPGSADFKVKVSDKGTFTAKVDKGSAQNLSLGKTKPKFTSPFTQTFNVPGFGSVTANGTGTLEYEKPKVKKGVITNAIVKVKGSAAGSVQ
jgi:hypothetical protein